MLCTIQTRVERQFSDAEGTKCPFHMYRYFVPINLIAYFSVGFRRISFFIKYF